MKQLKDFVFSIEDNYQIDIVHKDGKILCSLNKMIDLPYIYADTIVLSVKPGVKRNDDGSYSGYFIFVVS